MEDRKLSYFRTSTSFPHQFLHDKGIDPVEGMTWKVLEAFVSQTICLLRRTK